MASFDLNATASETWPTPSARVAGTAKTASQSGSKSKMATNPSAGNFRTSLPVSEDLASFAAQLSQDDVARNLLLLTMISGNMPFGSTISGNMHPLFPSLLPIGLPHQRFNNILPQNQNMGQLQPAVSDRASGKPRRRPANRSQSDRKAVPSSASRLSLIDSVSSRHMNGSMVPNANSNPMQTYSPSGNTIGNVEALSRNDLALSAGSNSMFTNRVRSRDHERNARRSSATLASAVPTVTTGTLDHMVATSGPSLAKSHSKLNHIIPSMASTRGEAASSRSAGIIKGKYSARSFKIPSFNEAEAAATLLGMRHGQNVQDRNAAMPSDLPTSTTLTSKTRTGVVHATNPIVRDGNRTTQHDSYGAVDLSTRSKSAIGVTLSNHCSLNPIPKQGNRISMQCKAPSAAVGPTVNINETRLTSSRVADITKRPDTAPTVADNRPSTTSLVSQCGNYICAFDLPASTVRWTNGPPLAPAPDQSQSTHTPAQQQAFNYKKVICEKFSQCASTGTVTYANSSHDHTASRMRSTDHSSKFDHLQSLSTARNCSNDVSCSKSGQSSFQPVQFMMCRSSSTSPLSYVANTSNEKSHVATTRGSTIGHHRPSFTTSLQNNMSTVKVDTKHVTDSNCLRKIPCCLNTAQPTKVDSINQLETRLEVPSFRDLRQKSNDSSVVTSGNQRDKNCIVSTSHESSFKSSNIYRIRNSAFGGSNDSLHSNSVEEHTKAGDIDSESSSCSSDSDESGDESDIEEKEHKSVDVTESNITLTTTSSTTCFPQRTRFVLSQAKFTLSNCESNDGKCNELVAKDQNDTDALSERSSPIRSKKSPNRAAVDEIHQADIPELKCDGTEHESTFKYKFIKALSNPDSKEGLAVDGKYLRALLGDEATCFYHNNKKYVLKRFLKPKDSTKHVEETGEAPVFHKSARKNNYQDKSSYSPEPEVQRKIEPRISVTAVKRSDNASKSQVKLSKKVKKSKNRPDDIPKKKATESDANTGRRLESSNMDDTKIKLPHNKRRRRNHEIENLIYEGAGGKTPIPDLSLRDSDVFSNIKLRRREAAKRGIVQTITPEEKQQESKTVLCRKRIKTAAHNRAIANKNRKKSIESKLRKYGKKDRQLPIRKDEFQTRSKSTTTRASCVRINAGFKNLSGSETGHHQQGQVGDSTTLGDNSQNNICVVSQERKCKPTALTDVILNRKTVDSGGGNTHDDDSGECASHISESLVVKKNTTEKADVASSSKISQRNSSSELSDTDNSYYRRTSKRISSRKQSNNERRSNEKKIDDDEISISSTNFETDSTHSDSPLRTRYHNANSSKSRKNYLQAAKLHRSITKTRNHKQDNKQCKFSLMSCFPTESAMTLAAAFGDLQPSYSMKTVGKGTLPSAPQKWNIGESALGTKQQLQRDVWRNMTLDMFTNS